MRVLKCPACFATRADEPQVELRGVNNKQDAKHPEDKSVATIDSFRSAFMRPLECHDLAKGHYVRGAVHSSGKCAVAQCDAPHSPQLIAFIKCAPL